MSTARHGRYVRAAEHRKLVCCVACGTEVWRACDLEAHRQALSAPLWVRALRRRHKNRGGLRTWLETGRAA